MSAPRVLFFAPYARWSYHTALEATWAHALRERGADVRHVVCDGVLPACDVFRENLNPRGEGSCRECQADVAGQMARLGAPWEWLSAWLPRAARQEAREWVDGLRRGELLRAEHRGRPLGRWAATSAYYQWRTSRLDLEEPRVEAVVRDLLHGAALTAAALEALLDEWRPDTLAMLNGRFFAHWTAFELARERGVRVVTHERGLRRDTVRFAENERVHELEGFRELWLRWGDVPLTAEELAWTVRLLDERRHGRNASWLTFSPPPQELEAVRAALRLDHRPVVAVFDSSNDETAAFPERRAGAFPDARRFLPFVAELARRRPDLVFVLRVHPNVQSAVGTNADQLADARALRASAPENVRVVLPRDDVSSYSLADLAAVGVVYASTIGLELACTGTPVLSCAQATYAHTGCARTVDRAEALEPAIDAALARRVDAEAARRALRWTHLYFTQYALPFGLVTEQPQHTGRVRWREAAELGEGRDPQLDRIASFLLGRGPIVPPVGPAERARTTAAEDELLAALAAQPAS